MEGVCSSEILDEILPDYEASHPRRHYSSYINITSTKVSADSVRVMAGSIQSASFCLNICGKAKIKLFLCLIERHSMKTYAIALDAGE
jgi:hypothetical protein